MFNFSFLLASTPKPFDIADIFRNIGSRWYVYVVIIFTTALLFTLVLIKSKKRNNLTSTQKLVYTAVFSALSFLANYLTIKVSNEIQISLIATIGFIAGYLLGPSLGFTASFLGDLICGIVAPLGVYSPVIGFASGLMGFIPGVLFTRLKFNDYINLAISFISVFVIASFFVNNVGIALLYGWTIDITVLTRLPFILVGTSVNLAVSYALLPVLNRVLPKDKFPFAKR